MSGYLHYHMKKQWKQQWFVIKHKVLYMYKASEDVLALESLPLLGYTVRTIPEVSHYTHRLLCLFSYYKECGNTTNYAIMI